MSITILNKKYEVDLDVLELDNNQLSSLPAEIGNLINLLQLHLSNNQLRSLPAGIGKLVNLNELNIFNNELSSLPFEIISIKNIINIDESAYEINNLDIECTFLIFNDLNIKLNNLPTNLNKIWLTENIIDYDIKLPFGCEIIKF